MNQKISKRFDELNEQMQNVSESRFTTKGLYGDEEFIDPEVLYEWKVKLKNLVIKACGEKSEHYKELIDAEQKGYDNGIDRFIRLKAVFLAAKEDFEGGYLSSVKSLIQAEVFEDELEQAKELLKSGYYLAAAVIAGVVLETGLRELCVRNSIGFGKLDKMNSDLAKAGIYNKLQQKRITALADIRNNAAHGKPENFKVEDVDLMIRDVEQFLSNYI